MVQDIMFVMERVLTLSPVLRSLVIRDALNTALDFLGKILTMRSRQRVVIVYPSCIGITVITCQAPLAMDSLGLVSNDARLYLRESAEVQPMSFPNYHHIFTFSF